MIPAPLAARRLASTLIVIAALLAATACASRGSQGHDLDAARSQGRLVVIAYPTPENPFFRWDPKNGPLPSFDRADRFAGIDVELLRRFAAELGLELWVRRVSAASYGQLIPDLVAGRGDLVAGAFSITEDRRATADFSLPYFETATAIVVRVDSPIAAVADLEGKIAAVLTCTSHEQRLLGLGLTQQQLHRVSSTWASLAAVEEGEVDFTAIEDWQGKQLSRALRIAFLLPGSERYGFALRPESDLRPALDAFLGEMQTSGELAEIVDRYAAP